MAVFSRPRSRRSLQRFVAGSAVVVLVSTIGLQQASAAAVLPEGRTTPSCTIWGGSGNDTLNGTTGNDVICGQAGNDTIRGNGGFDRIYGGSGADIIYGGNSTSTQPYGFSEELHGDAGSDRIYAGAGADRVFGEAGVDHLEAGDGNDTIYGDNGANDLGTDGDDTILAGAGNDNIHGNGRIDYINLGTNTGGDIAYGDGGNDIIVGWVGYGATVNGGSGNDFLLPTWQRLNPLGNMAVGGMGNDLAILVNGWGDQFIKDETAGSVPIPGPWCDIEIPVTVDPQTGARSWGLDCPVIGDVRVQVSGEQVTVGNNFLQASANWSPDQWRSWGAVNLTSPSVDVCACDPEILGPPKRLGDRIY
jgi:Ca2+-binding RTX toxin-like protein